MAHRLLPWLAAAYVLSTSGASLSDTASFDEYMTAFKRSYVHSSQEYSMRNALFHQRVKEVNDQNSKPDRLWTAGINHLTDRTEVELMQIRGYRRSRAQPGAEGPSLLAESAEQVRALPKEVDWTNVSTVGDQGSCGSCWAIATAGMLNAHSLIHMGTNAKKFSTQELVNCVPNPMECGGSGGCKGATVELAMKYVSAVGLSTDSEVPYEGSDQTCLRPAPSSLMETKGNGVGNGGSGLEGLSSWKTLPSNQAAPLMQALQSGPVAISAGASGWASYSNGIFDGCTKDAIIDHAIVLAGYGEESGKQYWTVQNSWGQFWGEAGFLRIKRHATTKEDDEHCGTDDKPGDGISCKPYPDKVTVCGMCGMLYDSVSPQFGTAALLLQSQKTRNSFLHRLGSL